MADRIIKGDSGNDVVIQNNAGSRKIEVTNSGDVEVTGDVKTTTVKATNLKANDGTAGISIADSTGRVSFTETNPSITLGSNTTFATNMPLQTVGVMDSAVATTTSTIASDDSIPQNTEGAEAFTLAITPSHANNKLLIHAFCGCISSSENSRRLIIALFKDSVSDALAASYADFQASGTGEQGVDLTHFMTAGSTSTITFKLRFGANSTGTTTFNGSGGARLMGGVMASGMTITEIKG